MFLSNQGYAKEKIQKDVPQSILWGLCYWPIFGFFNYRFVHVSYRPMSGSIAGIIWNSIMSNQTNKEPGASMSFPFGDQLKDVPKENP